MDALKERCLLFYLKASPACLYAQVAGNKHRPLLNVEDPQQEIENLLKQRASKYEQADYIVDADYKSINEISESIKEILKND